MAATSKSRESYYSQYKNQQRWMKNRERKLLRAMKRSPNNKQIELAIASIKYRRKKPGDIGSWSKTNIQIAQMFRLFTGRASRDLFSSNPKVQSAALAQHSRYRFQKQEEKVSFSLGARAHNGRGTREWG